MEIMLLKLYSYGKQELLQKLTTSSISDNKKPTDTQIFFEVQRKDKLEVYWDANGPEDAAAKLNPQLDLIFQFIL